MTPAIAQEIGRREDEKNVQMLDFRAPEVTLGYAWAAPIDIWELGCLVILDVARLSLEH